jgi:hypothetical protein
VKIESHLHAHVSHSCSACLIEKSLHIPITQDARCSLERNKGVVSSSTQLTWLCLSRFVPHFPSLSPSSHNSGSAPACSARRVHWDQALARHFFVVRAPDVGTARQQSSASTCTNVIPRDLEMPRATCVQEPELWCGLRDCMSINRKPYDGRASGRQRLAETLSLFDRHSWHLGANS